MGLCSRCLIVELNPIQSISEYHDNHLQLVLFAYLDVSLVLRGSYIDWPPFDGISNHTH